MIGFKKKKLK